VRRHRHDHGDFAAPQTGGKELADRKHQLVILLI
jgi:hypothetical protein